MSTGASVSAGDLAVAARDTRRTMSRENVDALRRATLVGLSSGER
jgi:hypothetical protein